MTPAKERQVFGLSADVFSLGRSISRLINRLVRRFVGCLVVWSVGLAVGWVSLEYIASAIQFSQSCQSSRSMCSSYPTHAARQFYINFGSHFAASTLHPLRTNSCFCFWFDVYYLFWKMKSIHARSCLYIGDTRR